MAVSTYSACWSAHHEEVANCSIENALSTLKYSLERHISEDQPPLNEVQALLVQFEFAAVDRIFHRAHNLA